MATSSIKKEVTITLTLNEYEARYLLALTQNFMGDDSNDEAQEDYELRHEVFHALKQVIQEQH